jgi:hypothetical protein
MIRKLERIVAGAACILLAGCGAQGEAYQPRPTPGSRSLVYVYRPYKFLSSQATPMITCGNESIELEPGGFFEMVEDSGPKTCSIVGEATSEYKFDARPGERYFIKEEVEATGLTTHARLIRMDPDVARDQIKECSRQGSKQ